MDQQVFGLGVPYGRALVEEPNLGDAVVGRGHPVPAAVVPGKEAPVLVRPRKLKASLAPRLPC